MHVKKFSVPHLFSSTQPGLGTLDMTWNCDTISMRWLKNYSFVGLCGHCCYIAFLMQKQGDCTFSRPGMYVLSFYYCSKKMWYEG